MPDKLPPPTGKPVKSDSKSSGSPKIIVWAFVLSIFGIFVVPAIAAIAMTIAGWKKVQATGKGRGLAIAALVISGVWLVLFAFTLVNQSSNSEISVSSETTVVQGVEPAPIAPQVEVIEEEVGVVEEVEQSETLPQSNARRQAESYLNYTAFSRKGLIEQLEFEGFSKEDATYGADAVGANWKEQAAKKAREYLDFGAFSRKSLIDQLEFEGFSSSQAAYGADSVGF